ncbi:pre-toxin TG domain-containing protein [Paenibacillus sp. Z6-24]
MNRDVLTGSIDNGLTMNRYAYVNGNPVSYIDPFGLSADGADWTRTAFSVGADVTPFVGTVKGLQEVFTGVDLITGEQLSVSDRVATGFGTALSGLPFGKVVGKTVAKEAIDGGAWLIGKLGKTTSKNGHFSEETIVKRYMADGRAINDITNLPGTKGMRIPNRLSVEDMDFLTKEYGVEFAQIYRAGTGRNGRGGYYELYSGVHNRVNVPLGKDVRLISHTHPRGTARPSPDDLILMQLLENAGSPQRTSQIVPVGKAPVNFDKNGLK